MGRLSDRTVDLTVKLVMTCVCIFFLIKRIGEYHLYYFKPLWVTETLIYVIFIAAFITRIPPKVRSRGFREIVVPLIGSGFPFLLLLSPPFHRIGNSHSLLIAIFAAMTLTTSFTIWALFWLRRSFSLTAEVRELVKGGPYRWVRHPMYLGEIMTAGIVTIWRFSMLNLVLFAAFTGIQLFRAAVEENKLAAVLGETYRSFALTRWWFLPHKRTLKPVKDNR
jgi:protein-S-isoprenylcysteine O-methyltransferase Ste14